MAITKYLFNHKRREGHRGFQPRRKEEHEDSRREKTGKDHVKKIILSVACSCIGLKFFINPRTLLF